MENKLIKKLAQYFNILKEYADNDVSFLRVVRRISVKNSEKVISIYSKEKYGNGFLYLEKIKWNGATEIIKKYEFSEINLQIILNEYEYLLKEYYLNIEKIKEYEFDSIIEFINKNRRKLDKYVAFKIKENLLEYKKYNEIGNNFENNEIQIFKLSINENLIGFCYICIEKLYDEEINYFDKRLVIKDILINESYELYDYEYYVIEYIRRYCFENSIRKINIETAKINTNLIKKLRKYGFKELLYLGELDINEVLI